MKRIGIFGMSGNPPHCSHLAIANECIRRNLVDKVWVLPTYNHTQKQNSASFEQRVKMCQMMFGNGLFSKIKVKRYEEMNKSGYMFDMIAILKSMFEKHEFYIIIGRDCADSISSWFNYEALRSTVPFIVFERFGMKEDFGLETWYFFKPHQMVTALGCDVSSTRVRSLVKCKEFSIIGNLTNKKIAEYIKKENLYEDITN